jgi:hypothetical protein
MNLYMYIPFSWQFEFHSRYSVYSCIWSPCIAVLCFVSFLKIDAVEDILKDVNKISTVTFTFEIFALLRCYAAQIGSYLPTFRNNKSAVSSRVKQSNKNAWPLKMGEVGSSETSVTNYQSIQRTIPEERKSYLHRRRCLKLRNFFVSQLWIKFNIGDVQRTCWVLVTLLQIALWRSYHF